ncbi:MAG TPA: arginine--tRNA ligase [Candidatus Paceibacterota bacterium]
MKDEIKAAIQNALTALQIEATDFVVDFPTDKTTTADFFSNVAMVLSKQLGKAPIEIARSIVDVFSMGTVVAEVAGPGFINFYINKEWYKNQLTALLANEAQWGRGTAQKGELVLVEYTSPNLFKPLHIGNLVGNIIGESLTRLFEYQGATVKRLNYPSDIGLTVAKAVWGLAKTAGDPEDILQRGEAYRFGNDAYENDEEAKAEIVAVNQALYAGSDASLAGLRAKGIATSKRQLDSICARLGTTFDAVIFESDAAPIGTETVKQNIGRVFEESDGAVVFKGEKVGLHTRVFLNSQGLPTYEAKDVGNFAHKRALFPEWTVSIVVTGNEQTEYFKVIYAAIKELFPDIEATNKKLEHIPTGFLTLTTGKMSSRKGNVLTGESLLGEMEEAAREKAAETRTDNIDQLTEEVAVASLKYQILRQAVGTNIVFDKEKALSFEGDSGPYLQYTYARIRSVLEKAAEAGVSPDTQLPPPQPYAVEKLLARFPAVLETALAERAPHKVAGYLTELAGVFNSFYATEKIADAADQYAPYKAAVARAVGQTLKNGLWTLGIKAPERM